MAEVTGHKSKPLQLKDMLRRVLTTAELPAPKPEVSEVEKLLQQLVRETQSQSTTGDSGNLRDSGSLRDSDPPDETGQM